MLQRSGEALYSNCACDKPRTCSATICVVISKCTTRCSRSSLVMEAATSGVANRQTLNVRIAQSRSIYARSEYIVKSMVVAPPSEYPVGRSKERKVITPPAKRQFPITERRTLNVKGMWGAWLLGIVARPCRLPRSPSSESPMPQRNHCIHASSSLRCSATRDAHKGHCCAGFYPRMLVCSHSNETGLWNHTVGRCGNRRCGVRAIANDWSGSPRLRHRLVYRNHSWGYGQSLE